MQRILFACAAVVTSSVEAGTWNFLGTGDGKTFNIVYDKSNADDTQPPSYIPAVNPGVRKHLKKNPSAHMVYVQNSEGWWGWKNTSTDEFFGSMAAADW